MATSVSRDGAAVSFGPSSVILDPETGFVVEKKGPAARRFTPAGSVPAGRVTLAVKGLSPGKTWVFRASPKKLEVVAENQLGKETYASPVACGLSPSYRLGPIHSVVSPSHS